MWRCVALRLRILKVIVLEMWILVMTLLMGLSVYADRLCPENQFLNADTELCQQCSTCGENDIISRTCSETNDTLCGKVNFSFIDKGFEIFDGKEKAATPYVVSLDEDELYWRNLAFALIIVLSLTLVISTVCVLVACYRFRQTGRFCKSVAQDQDDTESGYVVIHKFIPDAGVMSPDNPHQYLGASSSETQPRTPSPPQQHSHRSHRYRPYRPKRRMMNEYVDDVFESDDSSGSRTLRLPLEPIPEKSEGN